MIFRNFTPFKPLHFESRDAQCKNFGVVVARGTFKIHENEPLRLASEQEELVMADEFHGDPGQSSIRVENSIAPFKPRTDIHLKAIAHSPGNKPLPVFSAVVELGSLQKQIVVSGERYWLHRKLLGWRVTDPEPCTRVPIRYEYAYGGTWSEGETVTPCPDNFIGTGHVEIDLLDKSKPIAAPRIMAANDPVVTLGKAHRPEGLGPISPAWGFRLRHAGTFDAVWEKTRWPDLPADFKFDFYNSAHPDLIYPGYVRGDEAVKLINLSRSEALKFWLPGYRVGLLSRQENGIMLPLPMNLDTVHIDPEEMKVYLTWRGIFPLTDRIRALEIRMTSGEGA